MKAVLFFIKIISVLLISQAAGSKTAASKPAAFQGGKIYELNSNRKKLLFTLNAKLRSPDKETSIFFSSYLDTEQNEALTEEAVFNKFQLQKYVIHQSQLNETYELDVAENKMTFLIVKNGHTEKKTRDLPVNLVIGPSFVPFLHQHWSEIQSGKKVLAQLAVLERMDTYSFEFEKLRDAKSGNEEAMLIRMKPSNSFVSAVVRPVYFVVKADGSRIFELKGRMLPKQKVGGHWQDFEGEAVFSY